MTHAPVLIAALDAKHDRAAFDCGIPVNE